MVLGVGERPEERYVSMVAGSVYRAVGLCVSGMLAGASLACRPSEPPGAVVDDTSDPVGSKPRLSGSSRPRTAAPTTEDEAPKTAAPLGPAHAGVCPAQAADDIGILVSPLVPVAGAPLRVVAATLADERPLSVRIEAADGSQTLDGVSSTHHAGVPASTLATLESAPAGRWTIVVGREGQGLACAKVEVASSARAQRPRKASPAGVWPIERAWNPGEEALFSAWVRMLFDAERGEDLAWAALHEVTSAPERNFLHDHYRWSEDASPTDQGLYLKPDCADTPYFLRAYFAWKRQLPFGFRKCSRGQGGPPRCGGLLGVVGAPIDSPDPRKEGELGVVQRFFRKTLAWGVHSGNGRTAFADASTDFYPLALSRRALRPGMMYADPYGHIFVLVGMVEADAERQQGGILYAIDGQPDGSITRKRFWEGNFLWNPDPSLGGSGFKGFRPVEVDPTGALVQLDNRAIGERRAYPDMSDEQAHLSGPAFYDRMDALITPGHRDPFVAQREAIEALHEAAKVRVTSVQNGEENARAHGGAIAMPSGFAIFETTGAWENFSTPARDLRLLIAIDLVEGFADKVRRNADTFLRPGETLEQVLEPLGADRARLLADPRYRFEYVRSDGSSWSLGLADLIARASAFEVGYNPNDCAEVRWGAPRGSEEASTCRRRAPTDQQRAMASYRVWFKERRRPARGESGPPSEK